MIKKQGYKRQILRPLVLAGTACPTASPGRAPPAAAGTQHPPSPSPGNGFSPSTRFASLAQTPLCRAGRLHKAYAGFKPFSSPLRSELIFSEEYFFKAGQERNRVQDASAQGGSESAGKAPGTVLTWLLPPSALPRTILLLLSPAHPGGSLSPRTPGMQPPGAETRGRGSVNSWLPCDPLPADFFWKAGSNSAHYTQPNLSRQCLS